MQRIKGRDTKPEMMVRSYLHCAGFRFRLHCADLPGKPDIVLAKYRTVVFVHGCFWHQHPGCIHTGIPLSNEGYWRPKLESTIARDKKHKRTLRRMGWHVYIVWECQVNERRLVKLTDDIRKNAPA